MGHPNVTPDTQGKDAGHMADLRAQFRDGDTCLLYTSDAADE